MEGKLGGGGDGGRARGRRIGGRARRRRGWKES